MSNNLPYLFCLLGIFAFLTPTQAQPQGQIEDLTRDTDFFQDQTEVYQRWLDQSGLGDYLSVYDIEVEKDMLSIYLRFPFSDTDSILTVWKQLKSDFESQVAISLEEQLFYKASFIMEVRQSMVNVQLYDTYDLRKEPLFMRAVFFKDGELQLEESNPKSKYESIELSPADMSAAKEESVTAFQQRYGKQKVYDCIFQYAKQRFEATECLDRDPRVRLLQESDHLIFEVTDLCREVLTDEANPTLCEILGKLGYDCNWVKREMLRFTITHEETMSGFRLRITLDGKYGSGFYDTVKRGGYLDMEVDFDEYLEDYSDEFSTTLRRMLLNCE